MRLVFIPAHNEADTLGQVLEGVRRHTKADVLVIDDGSTDATATVAKSHRVHLLSHPQRQGYGGTQMSGFRWAADRNYEVVVTMDADLQHDPAALPDFLAAIERCDVASGTRYHAQSTVVGTAPEERRHINETITQQLRSITGWPLTDGFCGYKAYRVDALRQLRLTETGPAFPIQFWIQAWHAGLTLLEVPVARIYLDADRRFGGGLDDAERRLAYYRQVLEASLAAVRTVRS